MLNINEDIEVKTGLLQIYHKKDGRYEIFFKCLGCNCIHSFHSIIPNTKTNIVNHFDGNDIRPTVKESLHFGLENFELIGCSLYIIEGKIHYFYNCSHHLKGQVIDMEEIEL
jgi:hypothetical protein